MKPGYLIYSDDSGGEADAYRAISTLSGPAQVLLALERELRRVLALERVDELKWSALRTRPARLRAAQAFLELAGVGLAAGALRVDLLLWKPAEQGLAYRGRDEAGRLRPLYFEAWSRARAAWGPGRWNVHPDQRTGMRWQQWPAALKARWKRGGASLRRVSEASSRRSACVQLADLLAGLARLGAETGPASTAAAGRRARHNRSELLGYLLDCLDRRGLGVPRGPGLLPGRPPHLHVRLLRRLPTQV
ncbi:MAG TPA: hypothetical protein VK842_00320 [bacterium]|nr:hypothetical protein [bacterium]